MGSIRILFLLVQVIAQITFAPRSSAYQLSSPSNQPKSSAEEPSLKPVATVANPSVACPRRSEESPKAHAKRNLDGCLICLQSSDGGKIESSLACNHQFHKACLQSWREREGDSATCPKCQDLLPKPDPPAESSVVLMQVGHCSPCKHTFRLEENQLYMCPKCKRCNIKVYLAAEK